MVSLHCIFPSYLCFKTPPKKPTLIPKFPVLLPKPYTLNPKPDTLALQPLTLKLEALVQHGDGDFCEVFRKPRENGVPSLVAGALVLPFLK